MSNYQSGQKPSQMAEDQIIDTQILQTIIINGDAKTMVREADRIGKSLTNGKESDKLSTSQIRAIFGEVRQIQGKMKIPQDKERARAFKRLYLLKPKMKYRVAKENNKQGVKNLVSVLEPALDLVFQSEEQKEQRFEHFVQFFEAILAYHRAYGGK